MKDIMLADTPVEQRAQILRDSCDEVVEKSYLSKFSQEETNELRANLVEVQIQMQELTENFDVVKADFKGKMKPLQERIGKMLDDLRKGGEYIKGEVLQVHRSRRRKSRLLYARRLFAGGKTYEAGRKAENNSNGSALDWHR